MTADASNRANPSVSGPAALVSADPPVILSASWPPPLSLVEALAARRPDKPITFLLISTWHCHENRASQMAEAEQRIGARFPMHELNFLGNTPHDVDLLSAAGLKAAFINHNIFVPEDVFRPLPDVAVEFDAVYNARPSPGKRHELAADIDRVIHVSAVPVGSEAVHSREIVEELLRRRPRHELVNEIADGFPRQISPSETNAVLARAAVGLCLSAVEGAMYASIEYLTAGLPIVSTPSRGGRDLFFDPDYCVIAEPDPRDIRQAVEALRDRNIPRRYVRERTLAKLAPERHRFVALVEEIKARHGAPRTFDTRWTHSAENPMKWRRADDHARDFFGDA